MPAVCRSCIGNSTEFAATGHSPDEGTCTTSLATQTLEEADAWCEANCRSSPDWLMNEDPSELFDLNDKVQVDGDAACVVRKFHYTNKLTYYAVDYRDGVTSYEVQPATSMRLLEQNSPWCNDDELQCMALCKQEGFCCNDPNVGSNQLLSCAQACMIRARGSNAQECNEACHAQDVSRGCSREVKGHTYTMCSRCSDLDSTCPHGVQQSGGACQTGCTMQPWRRMETKTIAAQCCEGCSHWKSPCDSFSTVPSVTGDAKYSGAALIGTKVYFAPESQSHVGVLDTLTSTFSIIAASWLAASTQTKHFADATAIGNRVYFAPNGEDGVGVLDTMTSALTKLEAAGMTYGQGKYSSSLAVGTMLYLVPENEDHVGLLDTERAIAEPQLAFTTVGTTAAGVTGKDKFEGAVAVAKVLGPLHRATPSSLRRDPHACQSSARLDYPQVADCSAWVLPSTGAPCTYVINWIGYLDSNGQPKDNSQRGTVTFEAPPGTQWDDFDTCEFPLIFP